MEALFDCILFRSECFHSLYLKTVRQLIFLFYSRCIELLKYGAPVHTFSAGVFELRMELIMLLIATARLTPNSAGPRDCC